MQLVFLHLLVHAGPQLGSTSAIEASNPAAASLPSNPSTRSQSSLADAIARLSTVPISRILAMRVPNTPPPVNPAGAAPPQPLLSPPKAPNIDPEGNNAIPTIAVPAPLPSEQLQNLPLSSSNDVISNALFASATQAAGPTSTQSLPSNSTANAPGKHSSAGSLSCSYASNILILLTIYENY